ncbi:benzoate 4-monooxygenase cytochrome P450 [Metarhizium anisopliae]
MALLQLEAMWQSDTIKHMRLLTWYHWLLFATIVRPIQVVKYKIIHAHNTPSQAWIGQSIYRLKFHPLRRFPGPRIAACSSLYFLYWIYHGTFPQHCERLFDHYKSDVLRVAPNQLVFRTPQSLKDIIGRHDVYRGDFALRVIGFTSQNVSNIRDPAAHKRKRKLMNPGFSNATLAKQEPALVVPLVNKLVDAVAAKAGTKINMSNYFDCVTSDIIGLLSFGADFGMMQDPVSHPFLHVLPNALRMSVIAQCIPEIFRLLSFLFRHGPPFLVPKTFTGVADFAARHMRQRAQRDRDGVATDRNDIMSIIVDGTANVKDDNLRMDNDEMLGEATTLVTGGGDTVATALTVTMWNLGRNTKVLAELQDQVRSTFASCEDITSRDVASKIPMIDAVLNESMRTNPVLPGPMWRRTDAPIVVAGHVVPGGTEVGVMRLSVFQHKDAFHKPKEWIPERWLRNLGDHLEAFQPFGVGPRTCIGRYIAMVEMRLILTKLLWKFDWELLTKDYDNPEYVVLYRSPLWMKPSLRKDSMAERPAQIHEPS